VIIERRISAFEIWGRRAPLAKTIGTSTPGAPRRRSGSELDQERVAARLDVAEADRRGAARQALKPLVQSKGIQ
jgi:hypothetical protein